MKQNKLQKRTEYNQEKYNNEWNKNVQKQKITKQSIKICSTVMSRKC